MFNTTEILDQMMPGYHCVNHFRVHMVRIIDRMLSMSNRNYDKRYEEDTVKQIKDLKVDRKKIKIRALKSEFPKAPSLTYSLSRIKLTRDDFITFIEKTFR